MWCRQSAANSNSKRIPGLYLQARGFFLFSLDSHGIGCYHLGMYPQEKAIKALKDLLAESVQAKDMYTQVAASRAMLALFKRYPAEMRENESFKKAVREIADNTRAVAQMLGLHLTQNWREYLGSLTKWQQFARKSEREEWINLQRRTLKMRAVARVHEVLLKTYPKGIQHPEMARIFTENDLLQMEQTSSSYLD